MQSVQGARAGAHVVTSDGGHFTPEMFLVSKCFLFPGVKCVYCARSLCPYCWPLASVETEFDADEFSEISHPGQVTKNIDISSVFIIAANEW